MKDLNESSIKSNKTYCMFIRPIGPIDIPIGFCSPSGVTSALMTILSVKSSIPFNLKYKLSI